MKKNIVYLILTAFILIIPNVKAVETKLPEVNEDGVITLTEDVILENGFIVEASENIAIFLNGNTLTTKESADFDTIYVKEGGILKIFGEGTISNKSNAGYAPIFNNGNLTIKEATITRDNGWYVVVNHGEMTMDGANVIGTKREGLDTNTSLITNGYVNYKDKSNERIGQIDGINSKTPTLTINGGTYDSHFTTLKNDDLGILIVESGTFTSEVAYPLQNANKAQINGGIFEAKDKNHSVLYLFPDTTTSLKGTFKGAYLTKSPDTGNPAVVTIENSTIKVNEVNLGVEPDIEINTFISAPKSMIKYAKSGTRFDVNDAKAGDVITNIPEGVTVDIAYYDIEENLFKSTDEFGNIVFKKYADFTKLYELLDKIESLDENMYTEESVNAFIQKIEEIIKKYEDIEPTEDNQKELDKCVEEIEKAYDLLTKKDEEKEEIKNNIENPNTGDNIMLIVLFGLISLIGIGLVTNKFRKSL